jgi:hypothetical protein
MSIKSANAGNCKTNLFADVIALMQDLDRQLEYPNCEGYNDEKRLTNRKEQEFFAILQKHRYFQD